jgi:hypothetical protein
LLIIPSSGLVSIAGMSARSEMADQFHYEAAYKVLICREHKLAVKGLARHLKDAHDLRSKVERQPINR